MRRRDVRLGVDRDRAQAEAGARGADHAAGDLAAVGDQDGVESPVRHAGPAVMLAPLAHDHPPAGWGLKSLHGLFICGQLETRTCQDVHLGAERHPLAWPGDAIDDAQRAVCLDGDVHEPVEVGDDVAGAHAVPGRLGEEVLPAAVLGHRVMAVAQGVGLLAARAADRVLPVDLVGDHRGERVALVGPQDGARAHVDVARPGDRVGHAVPLGGIAGAVQQAVRRLISADVHDREDVALLYYGGPRGARRDDLVADYRAVDERTG